MKEHHPSEDTITSPHSTYTLQRQLLTTEPAGASQGPLLSQHAQQAGQETKQRLEETWIIRNNK